MALFFVALLSVLLYPTTYRLNSTGLRIAVALAAGLLSFIILVLVLLAIGAAPRQI